MALHLPWLWPGPQKPTKEQELKKQAISISSLETSVPS
jgi:hypothetical protein